MKNKFFTAFFLILINLISPKLAVAEEFISNEPFNKAGLFETVLINPFGAFVDK